MTCDEFRDALLIALSGEAIDCARAEHGECAERECREALRTAQILAQPLAHWSEPCESNEPVHLARAVADAFAASPRPVTGWSRRQWVTVASATLSAAVLVAAFLVWPMPSRSNLLQMTTAHESASRPADPVAVAYVNKTERWLAEATQIPLRTDFDFEVTLEEPTRWFTSTFKPLTDTFDEFVPTADDETAPST